MAYPYSGSEELYRGRMRGFHPLRDATPGIVQQLQLAGDRTGGILGDTARALSEESRRRGQILSSGLSEIGSSLWGEESRRREAHQLRSEREQLENQQEKLKLDAAQAEEDFLNGLNPSREPPPAPVGDLPPWKAPGESFDAGNYTGSAPSLGIAPTAGRSEEGRSRRRALLEAQFGANMGGYREKMADQGMGDYRRGEERRRDDLAARQGEQGLTHGDLANQLLKKQIATTGTAEGLALKDRAEAQAAQAFLVALAQGDEGMLAQTRAALKARGLSDFDVRRIEGVAQQQHKQQVQATADANYLIKPGGQALSSGVATTRQKLQAADSAMRAFANYKYNAGNELVPGDLPGQAAMGLRQFTEALGAYNPMAGDVDKIQAGWKSGVTTPSQHMGYVLTDTINALKGDIQRMEAEARMIDGTTVGAATRDVMSLKQQLQTLEAAAGSAGVSAGGAGGGMNNVDLLKAKKNSNSQLFQGGGAATPPGGAPVSAPAPPRPADYETGITPGAPQASVGMPGFRHLARAQAASPYRRMG